MLRFTIAFMLAGVLNAQTPAAAPAAVPAPVAVDRLGRKSPQDAMVQFLEACHAHNYAKAAHYLDLSKMPAQQRAKEGPVLAQQLEDLLDDLGFDITTLSQDPEGDPNDGLPPRTEKLATYDVDGKPIELQLQRKDLKTAGLRVWLVTPESVELIPQAHQLIKESPLEKRLPQALVELEFLDTPVWRWIALLGTGILLWLLTGLLTRALLRYTAILDFRTPLRWCVTALGMRAAMEFAEPAALARLIVERGLMLMLAMGVAGLAAAAVDAIGERWRTRLDPRMQAVSYSVLPLVRQVFKLSLYLAAVLLVLSLWGYNTGTILAGLGVGGLAVALAAQKTIENLFGGISVIGDRPVLVGDVCRFGGRTGTVMHIGLRSTRLRTAERTIISVPNGQFSAMELENLSGRDKIWFHPTLNLRRETTPDQMQKVLASLQEILGRSPKVESAKMPVRFVGVGTNSLDVEVDAYVATSDNDEFMALRQQLLLEMLKAVEQAGTGLAVPA